MSGRCYVLSIACNSPPRRLESISLSMPEKEREDSVSLFHRLSETSARASPFVESSNFISVSGELLILMIFISPHSFHVNVIRV